MKKFLNILKWSVAVLSASLLLSALYYAVFAFFFSTDVEKALIDENAVFEQKLSEVEEALDMVSEELNVLHRRDEAIYRSVFKAELPDVDHMLEGVPSDDALAVAGKIEKKWRQVFANLDTIKVHPPMVLPVSGLSYTNVGASVGERMNPFYKVKTMHDGIDLVAPEGTPVLATASGYVTAVVRSMGGNGNLVEITHSGGYVTRYAHLSEIGVDKGSYVKRGSRIGSVGDSGRSFTTHLHYSILCDGEVVDPTHFFFGSLTPDEYMHFLIMSVSSGQSMD